LSLINFSVLEKKSCFKVGARCLATAVHGAVHNVLINLENITDESYVQDMKSKADNLAEGADDRCAKVLQVLSQR